MQWIYDFRQEADSKDACFDPDLMWNEIGASGATAMLGMLEKNHSLTELKLAGNNIPCQLLGQIGIRLLHGIYSVSSYYIISIIYVASASKEGRNAITQMGAVLFQTACFRRTGPGRRFQRIVPMTQFIQL